MVEKILEFRGTPLSGISGYFEELGGRQLTETFPIIYKGSEWQVEVLREEELQITSRFFVNAIHIRFLAQTQVLLEELIAKFRKKTLRVGG